MGVSFAIPIDVANNVKDQLVEHRQGHARPHRRRDPGSERSSSPTRSASTARAARWSAGRATAARRTKAGIKPGDVILKVDGKTDRALHAAAGADRAAEAGHAGQRSRCGATARTKTLGVKVEIQEKSERVANSDAKSADEAAQARPVGAAAGAEETQGAETEGYLLVEDVDGPAARAGVRLATSSSASTARR